MRNATKMGGSVKKKYQGGGSTAADKVAQQRAINEKRKAEAQARTEKAKADARAKIDQAQKNKPVVKPAEPVAPAVTPNRKSDSEYRTVIANPKIATIEMYNNKKVLRDSDRTGKNGNRVVVQKTKEGDTVTRTKKVYNPGKETLTTKTKTYDRGNRKATMVKTKNTTSTKPKPIKPIWGDPHTLKKGGTVKKYQKGGVIVASPIDGPRRKVAGSNMAKGGQTFPDLTGDNKVTMKDVLKGRGVIKKKGGQAHPGFKAVQAKIAAKSGVSKKAAGAILAASTRKASAKAKAANPRLKKVK
jgi:hypothetical protein